MTSTELTPAEEAAGTSEIVQRLLGLGFSPESVQTLLRPPDADLALPPIPPTGSSGLIRVFEGEDSGTSDTGRANLSQGNGNEWNTLATMFGWGTVLPMQFQALFVTIGARSNPGNGSQYQLTRSVGGLAPSLVGPVLPLASNVLAQVYPVAEIYNAGDVLNIWTVEGGATDIVGCVWGVWT